MPDELKVIREAVPFTINGNLADDEPGMSSLMLNWMAHSTSAIPPYWSRARDAHLRTFFRDNGPLKTAVTTFVNKVVTIPWTIQAKDPTMTRQVQRAHSIESSLRRASGSMSAGPLRGFKNAFKMFALDYVTQDNGAFMIVLGEGPADGPIVGAPTGVMHLDSSLCSRTRDAEYPVKYLNRGQGGDNKEYKIHYTRLIEMVNLPSTDIDLNGVGLCPVSCCIEAAQELWDIYRYNSEKMGSRPPKQILYAETGATVKNLQDAIRTWQVTLDNEARTHFGGTLLAAPRVASQELRLKVLSLSNVPDGFDRRDATIINKGEIAAAFGLDLRDLAFSFGMGGQTRADAEVQDRKGRGKGVGEFIETFVERFEEVYLNNELWGIHFDNADDEQDEQQSLIRDTRSQARERDLRAGVTTIRLERELMWERSEISQVQFEDMELLDGRLPNGLDVLLLFQAQDSAFRQWLDLGVPDPTNLTENDPAQMADLIHDRIIEISTEIHAESNRHKARQARQALAALEKLRSLYQTPEGSSLTEQVTLEAMDEGMEQGMEPAEGRQELAADAEPEPAEPEPAEETTKEIAQVKALSTPDEIAQLLREYERDFLTLLQYAIAQEMPRRRFEQELADLVSAILLALFLRGSKFDASRLSGEMYDLLQSETSVHLAAIEGLANDLYDGRYSEEGLGLGSALTRLGLWLNMAVGVYFVGMLQQEDDPLLRWRIGISEHCADCARLNGQVHRASAWLASGWRPRSRVLECDGFNCQCMMEPSNGPEMGSF